MLTVVVAFTLTADDEHARWSVIEERRQKAQLVPELLSQRLREAFLRENYFVVSGCVSSHMGRSFYDLPLCSCLRLKVAMHWTSCGIRAKGELFIDASKEPPFSFLFNCEITCKKKNVNGTKFVSTQLIN